MDDMNNTLRGGSPPVDHGAIIAQIEQLIAEIIGSDAAELLDISEQSSFVGDLEMDSIQIVHLAEHINERYGKQVDFVGWLSSKSVKELLALTVGNVAAFIEESI
jgi:acyl carrier protein